MRKDILFLNNLIMLCYLFKFIKNVNVKYNYVLQTILPEKTFLSVKTILISCWLVRTRSLFLQWNVHKYHLPMPIMLLRNSMTVGLCLTTRLAYMLAWMSDALRSKMEPKETSFEIMKSLQEMFGQQFCKPSMRPQEIHEC